MLLMILTVLPLILLWPTWKFYRKEGGAFPGWRKVLFLAGVVVNLVSTVVLISFTINAYLVSRGTTPVDLDRMYPVLSMLGLGLVTAGLALSGKRISRLILVGNGLLTAFLWYLVGLAASP